MRTEEDLYLHLLKLRGMDWDTKKKARFYQDCAEGRILIAEEYVTARECWDFNGYWSLFHLADGPTARRLGADAACWA